MSNFPDFANHGYQVVRELGRNLVGGRITYLAKSISPTPSDREGVSVVIKQFHFGWTNSDWSGFKAYEREIQVLRSLNHSGIPRYLDSFETSAGFCMVQEYKNAQSLAVPRSFDPDDIKQIATSILEILIYLQKRIPPVIHRDIKPENILVDDDLNVYLVDFGFARIGGGDVAMSSVALGTLGFMPPEQLYNRQLSEATDLYGLGATLICLLSGTKSTQIDSLIDEDGRIDFKPLVPKLSLRFIDWIERMVQPKQKDRFENATAAKEALGPIYPIRLPEVNLSESLLEFQATTLSGERLTQTITVSNAIAETILSGRWEVAPHESDPPHTPETHAWISFKPAQFASNQAECQITVDTSKLIPDKTYERQILLHSNGARATTPLKIRVQTNPLQINYLSLYWSFAILCGTSFGVAWLVAINWAGASTVFATSSAGSWVAALICCACFSPLFSEVDERLKSANRRTKSLWIVGLCGLAASFGPVGLGLILALFGAGVATSAKVGAMAEARARGMLNDSQSESSQPFDMVATGFWGLVGAGFGSIGAAMLWAMLEPQFGYVRLLLAVVFAAVAVGGGTKAIAHQMQAVGFALSSGVAIRKLIIALGLSLGAGLQIGFSHPLLLAAVAVTSLPLAAFMIYQPMQRSRLLANSRQHKQNLIKP